MSNDAHESTALYRRVLLLRQLRTSTYQAFSNMTEYIINTMTLVQLINDGGRTIEDSEIVELLLSGLPRECDFLVTELSGLASLNSEIVRTRLLQEEPRIPVATSEVTVKKAPLAELSTCLSSVTNEIVKTRLLQEELRMSVATLESAVACNATGSAALAAKRKFCHYCGKHGHEQVQCRHLNKDTALASASVKAKSAARAKLICSYCGNEGHIQRRCYQFRHNTASESAVESNAIGTAAFASNATDSAPYVSNATESAAFASNATDSAPYVSNATESASFVSNATVSEPFVSKYKVICHYCNVQGHFMKRCTKYHQDTAADSLGVKRAKLAALTAKMAPLGTKVPCEYCNKKGHTKETCLKFKHAISSQSALTAQLAPLETKVRCGYCNKKGHTKNTCFKFKHDVASTMSNATEPAPFVSKRKVCLYCNEQGHWMKSCKKFHQDNAADSVNVRRKKIAAAKAKYAATKNICDYCDTEGHNKATCPKFKHDTTSSTMSNATELAPLGTKRKLIQDCDDRSVKRCLKLITISESAVGEKEQSAALGTGI